MLYATLGAISGFLSVLLGAFAAHGLKARLAPDLLAVFETGVRYQFYHALALLAVAWAIDRSGGGALPRAAGLLFVIGTVIFSGSLYALALSGLRWLGAITPFGGTAFLVGWGAFAWAARGIGQEKPTA